MSLRLVLRDQCKLEAAEEIHLQGLSAREKLLGKEHRSTLTNLNNLGSVIASQGKYEQAEELHRQALSARREKILGREHPQALTSLNNLEFALGNQGKLEEAEVLHRRALSGGERILGQDHPDTLLSSVKKIRASDFGDQGQVRRAPKKLPSNEH